MGARAIRRRERRAATLAALLLSGCAVGPDFHSPAAPATTGYTRGPLGETASADVAGGAAQRFVPGQDIPGQWWSLFHSPALNHLIEQAFKTNTDLSAAQAALRVAQENVLAQQGAYYPAITGSFSSSRNKTATGTLAPAAASGNPYYSLHTTQVSVSYAPDVFGLNQRTVESLQAQADQQRFQLEATYLTLTSNLVAAAVQEASLRGQIDATRELLKLGEDLLQILRRQYALGQIAQADVVAQETALAQAQQLLPPLEKQLEQQRDLVTALAGHFPADQPAETFELSSLDLPQDLPVSLPAKLVEQRPDLRAAEEKLHSAGAQIGVAIANRLPNLQLSADLGSAATQIGRLFTPGNGFWDLTGTLTQPIFEGGMLLHRQRAAEAAYDQAAAQYRSAVIAAFQDVADTLHALQSDAQALAAANAAERKASESLTITRRQLELGQINYLSLLNAQQTYQQTRISLVQAQAARFADTAALFQALGGGWWNRTDIADGADNPQP